MGEQVKCFDPVEWEGDYMSVVVTANLCKLTQDGGLTKLPMEILLVEASPTDRVWI